LSDVTIYHPDKRNNINGNLMAGVTGQGRDLAEKTTRRRVSDSGSFIFVLVDFPLLVIV